MRWTMKSLVLPLVLLCTWGLQEGAQACSCLPVHPQTAFCQADVVIKAEVLAWKLVGGYEHKYDVKQIKMFKGAHRYIDAVYTPASSAACGVTFTKGVEYLITGRLAPDGSLHVISCDFIMPWDNLTACQKSNLAQSYRKGCVCQITLCHATPCSSRPFECSWTDFVMNSGSQLQSKHFACLKGGDGFCGWIRGIPSTKQGYQGL
ncbi:metalloproteinase inhibitor 2-like [Dunckerocampus dactyliophorus]|uniref:metalloproteinase inhibitor 2-like n=1 Tax=Dunckerocampus dactyliophorus TaxID=161453 RepID=UPI002404B107|nr:metalloproteinase inhibitor 2-like [Dunckerocampus dactyliophorus]